MICGKLNFRPTKFDYTPCWYSMVYGISIHVKMFQKSHSTFPLKGSIFHIPLVKLHYLYTPTEIKFKKIKSGP